MPSHFAGVCWSLLGPEHCITKKNLKNGRICQLGRNPGCMSSPFRLVICSNFQSYFKNFTGHNFQSCCRLKFSKKNRLICHIIGLSNVGVDAGQQIYVLISGFGDKIPDFYWGSKIFFFQELSKIFLF